MAQNFYPPCFINPALRRTDFALAFFKSPGQKLHHQLNTISVGKYSASLSKTQADKKLAVKGRLLKAISPSTQYPTPSMLDMVEHRYVEVNGLKLHVAEIGNIESSDVVLFLHGFPEIWFTWRHQMVAVANAGFRAIAPDFRGYGLSDPPPVPEDTTFPDFVNDLAAILDALNIPKVFIIGKDFGSMVAYEFALQHKGRVSGVLTLGVPFMPPTPLGYDKTLPEGFYVTRWQEPGRAEADFGRLDAKTVVRNLYILFSKSEIPIAGTNQEIMDLVEPSTPLPSWITEEEFETYGALYEKSGFQTALQVPYRELNNRSKEPNSCNLADLKVEAPSLLIMGEEDYVFKLPGMEDYIKSEQVKTFVPKLEVIYIPEGNHFVHEQLPVQVNQLILTFLQANIQS